MSETVTIENLRKSFGSNAVLDDISLSLSEGTVFGLVGLNGAGKTTLFRLLLGLLRPDQGSVRLLGFDPWQHDRSLFRRIGVILEHDGFWGNLTFRENLAIFASAKGLSRHEIREYLDNYWSPLEAATAGKKSKFWSRGQKMQAALCRAFLGWPGICLMDEPGVALDVDAFDLFMRLVTEARDRGSTVLISSHQLESIEKLADRIAVLRDGALRVLSDSSATEDWILAADGTDVVGAILARELRTTASFKEGVWRFEVADQDRAVPALVRSLVASGIDVREIRPAADRLRARIRRISHGG